MIILKYGSKFRLGLFLISTGLSSLQYIFQAYIVGNFITAATNEDMNFFFRNVIIAIIGFPIFGLVMIANVSVRAKYIQSINLEIKLDLIDSLMRKKLKNIDVSKDLSFMTNDLKLLETNGINAELSILTSSVTFLLAIVFSLYYDIWTTVAFFAGSLIPVVFSNLIQGQIQDKSEKWSKETSKFTSCLKDLLTGIRTIRTYQAEKEMTLRVTSYAVKMENALKDMNQMVGFANTIIVMIATLCALTLPFGVGIYRIINGSLALGAFISVIQLSNYLNKPLLSIFEMRNQLQTTQRIQMRIKEASSERYTKGVSQKNNLTSIGIEMTPFSKLELHDLNIELGDKMLISGINLTIHAGEKLLIMAPSGFGKSTLLRVLQGDFPVTRGEYLYNGISSSDYDTLQLREQFSFILQTPFVFNDTVHFNVTLGRSFPEKKILYALEQAGMYQFISEKGLDYIIGENGENLSGGELQRVEIARAFLYNRPILLADEATSSLDNVTADHIRQTFINGANTLIEVAHKVSIEEQLLYDRVIQLEGH